MLDTGNRIIINASLIAFIYLFKMACAADDSYYYACSYQDNHWGTDVVLSKINLNHKAIEGSVGIPLPGEIQFKKPIQYDLGSDVFFFVTTIDGMPAKNSQARNEFQSNYAILDKDFSLMRSGNIPSIQFSDFSVMDSVTANIRYIDSAGRYFKGRLALDHRFQPDITPIEQESWDYPSYPEIGGFRYFKKIHPQNGQLFWNVTADGVYLLRLDVGNGILLDSLNIKSQLGHFYLFAISEDHSTTYVFYMNGNIVGGPESLRDLTIEPSYVKMFDSDSFALLDSIRIFYPPLDSGYVMGATGTCDRVGDYLVYFDLNGEDYRYFSPAMLFIFDTRTNEASWLRVGWR